MQIGIDFCILAVLLFLACIVMIFRRCQSRRKLKHMTESEKAEKLSALTKPFGFVYETREDVFVSTVDAWQRSVGYEALYDALATKFNMIFDSYPIYFDYGEKTWLIEFWKGQYGINTGAEVGVYHANRLIPKGQRKLVHYNTVSNEEMPLTGMCLERKEKKLFSEKEHHWWLAAFKMGVFSQPQELKMYADLCFESPAMAQAFEVGLKEADVPIESYRIRGQRVSVVLNAGRKYGKAAALYRKILQRINHLYCMLYRFVTFPYTKTTDRMLFLYGQLPWCFKHMLRLHVFGSKHR